MAVEKRRLINFVKKTGSHTLENIDAIRLIKVFKDNGGWNDDKTHSVFFDQETLSEMLRYLDLMTGRNPVRPGSGWRIYFAQYPQVDPKDKERDGRKTLVIMPTFMKMKDGKPEEQDGLPVHFDEIEETEARSLAREINDGSKFDWNAYNHGQMCPIRCPTGAVIPDDLP